MKGYLHPMVVVALLLAASLPTAVAQPRPVATSDAARIIDRAVTPATWHAEGAALAPAFADMVVAQFQSMPATQSTIARIAENGHGEIAGFKTMLAEEYTRSMMARFPRFRQAFVDFLNANMTPADLHAALAQPSGPGGAKLRALAPRFSEVGREAGTRLGEESGKEAVERAVARAIR